MSKLENFTLTNEERNAEQVSAIRERDARQKTFGNILGCDHSHWTFKTHGARCSCGKFIVDAGD